MEEIIRNLARIRDNNIYFSLEGEIISGSKHDFALFDKYSKLENFLKENEKILSSNNLDFSDKCYATINVNILPKYVKLTEPSVTILISNVNSSSQKPVTFSKCRLNFDGFNFYGILFFPHMDENKSSTVEIIAPFIPGLKTGDRIQIDVNSKEFQILENGN